MQWYSEILINFKFHIHLYQLEKMSEKWMNKKSQNSILVK